MTLAELRELAERLPPGAGLTLPREVLLALCGVSPPELGDLTAAQLAERLGRKPSTVRGWCERGDLPGAYRLKGREWRIPRGVLQAFEAGQRTPARAGAGGLLGDWRKVRPTSGADAP